MVQDPLVHAFDLLVRRNPAAVLLAGSRGRITAAEVDARARAFASALPEPRPAPGTPVGLWSPRAADVPPALLALLRARLPAVLLDGAAPPEERGRTLRRLGAAGCLAARPAGPAWEPASWPAAAPLPPGIGVVKLTSGSTGDPRGIATPTEALLADDAALWSTMGLGLAERILAAIPLTHSYGLSSVLVPALVRGIPLVLPGEGPLGPLLRAAEDGATFYPTVPAWLGSLVRLSSPPPWPRSVRTVVSAGAPLPPETARAFRERFGLPVHAFYGASECGGIAYDREGTAGERGTVGTPVDGVRVALDDPAEPGRVIVTSAAVAAGYLPDPDPALAEGTFRAGDLAAWDGGELRLAGRLDALINVKGKKVHPGEVEAVVSALPGVEEAIALALPSGVLRVVVVAPEGAVSADRVLAWCRERLADHKVPRSVVLVPAIPRTGRGKVDRAALAAL